MFSSGVVEKILHSIKDPFKILECDRLNDRHRAGTESLISMFFQQKNSYIE